MNTYLLAFLTGLTTGGLSCLAVQGGLLASSLASQVEADLAGGASPRQVRTAGPILWFLLAKLIAYTLLGSLLGWLGSLLQLNPLTRAVLLVAIGLFMIGQALRLLNVHPIFRYFNLEPPKAVTRYIRRQSKNGSGVIVPAFLGALTVLIPCGITQIVMASAMASGSPVTGGLLLFSFILGTSPVFFVVAYFATKLGARLEKSFTTAVAIVVLVLGILSIRSGVNLAGLPSLPSLLPGPSTQTQKVNPAGLPGGTAPVTGMGGCMSSLLARINPGPAGQGAAAAPQVVPAAPSSGETYQATLQVLDDGYSPREVHVPAGRPLQLVLVSQDVRSCSLAFVIPALDVQVLLDPTGRKTIDIPAQAAGTRIPFSCSMGMYTGVILVDS